MDRQRGERERRQQSCAGPRYPRSYQPGCRWGQATRKFVLLKFRRNVSVKSLRPAVRKTRGKARNVIPSLDELKAVLERIIGKDLATVGGCLNDQQFAHYGATLAATESATRGHQRRKPPGAKSCRGSV